MGITRHTKILKWLTSQNPALKIECFTSPTNRGCCFSLVFYTCHHCTWNKLLFLGNKHSELILSSIFSHKKPKLLFYNIFSLCLLNIVRYNKIYFLMYFQNNKLQLIVLRYILFKFFLWLSENTTQKSIERSMWDIHYELLQLMGMVVVALS